MVDDNEDAAHTLTRLLNVLGLDAVAAYCGKSAIEEVERCRPALVFLDLCMPGMDGVETAAAIRQCSDASQTVLVALSGIGEMEESARLRDAGFATHLSKPLNIAVLERTLTEFVGYRPEEECASPK